MFATTLFLIITVLLSTLPIKSPPSTFTFVGRLGFLRRNAGITSKNGAKLCGNEGLAAYSIKPQVSNLHTLKHIKKVEHLRIVMFFHLLRNHVEIPTKQWNLDKCGIIRCWFYNIVTQRAASQRFSAETLRTPASKALPSACLKKITSTNNIWRSEGTCCWGSNSFGHNVPMQEPVILESVEFCPHSFGHLDWAIDQSVDIGTSTSKVLNWDLGLAVKCFCLSGRRVLLTSSKRTFINNFQSRKCFRSAGKCRESDSGKVSKSRNSKNCPVPLLCWIHFG